MRLPKVQLILLLLSPILLAVILVFAKCGECYIQPLSVSSDGNTLVYWGSQNDPSVGLRLFRDEGGVVSSVDFPPIGLHGFGRVVSTPKWIVVCLGNKVYFVDPADFSNVEERSYLKGPGIWTNLVVSGNQKYLFYSANLEGTGDYRSGIIDLSTLDLTWQYDGSLIDTDRAYCAARNSFESESETVAVGNLLDVYSRDDAGNTITQTYEFEGGKPVLFVSPRQPSNLNTVPAVDPFWTRDRSVSIDTIGVEVIATNHENGKVKVLGQLRDEIRIVAQSDKQVLLVQGRERDLVPVDLASLEIGQTVPHVSNSSYFDAATISTDGQTIARKAMFDNLTWPEYLRSECGYYRHHIEILDAKTGQRIRVSENRLMIQVKQFLTLPLSGCFGFRFSCFATFLAGGSLRVTVQAMPLVLRNSDSCV